MGKYNLYSLLLFDGQDEAGAEGNENRQGCQEIPEAEKAQDLQESQVLQAQDPDPRLQAKVRQRHPSLRAHAEVRQVQGPQLPLDNREGHEEDGRREHHGLHRPQ